MTFGKCVGGQQAKTIPKTLFDLGLQTVIVAVAVGLGQTGARTKIGEGNEGRFTNKRWPTIVGGNVVAIWENFQMAARELT